MVEATTAEYVQGLAARCESHDDWLSLVRFGLKTLLDDQVLLIGLIIDEAQRRAPGSNAGGDVGYMAHTILEELGLKLVVA